MEDPLQASWKGDFSMEWGYFRNFPLPSLTKMDLLFGPPLAPWFLFHIIFVSVSTSIEFFLFSGENEFKLGDNKFNDVIFWRQQLEQAKSGTDRAQFPQ